PYIPPLSLHAALPILLKFHRTVRGINLVYRDLRTVHHCLSIHCSGTGNGANTAQLNCDGGTISCGRCARTCLRCCRGRASAACGDRKSTRLNSSHVSI